MNSIGIIRTMQTSIRNEIIVFLIISGFEQFVGDTASVGDERAGLFIQIIPRLETSRATMHVDPSCLSQPNLPRNVTCADMRLVGRLDRKSFDFCLLETGICCALTVAAQQQHHMLDQSQYAQNGVYLTDQPESLPT